MTELSGRLESDFLFRRNVHLDEGPNEIFARATDASGNVTPIKHYEVNIPSAKKTYEYDLNDNHSTGQP